MSHRRRFSAVLAAGALSTLVLTTTAPAASADTGGPGEPGQPGRFNALTDVAGLQVGQIQAIGDGYLTGTTVVYAPDMAVAGVSQTGGAPATKEMDLLSPLNSNPGVNAVALTGGSAYGLDTTTGMMRWLEEQGEGVSVGAGVVPIVPGMAIFDLNRGGQFDARPTDDWGYRALVEATSGDVSQGTVGGGTGGRSGGLKGGVGTASITLADGTVVAAIVVVNSVGSAVDPVDCSLVGARFEVADEFAGLATPSREECHPGEAADAAPGMNTTIGLIATDANLGKASAAKLAAMGQDGMTRAINPLHTLSDGDTVVALSTGTTGTPLQNNIPADTRALNQIYNAGADVMSRAVVHAILNASSQGTTLSYCDTYPSACADLQLAADPGTAVMIDPANPLTGTVPTPGPTTGPTEEPTTGPEPTEEPTTDPEPTSPEPTDGSSPEPTDGPTTPGATDVPSDDDPTDGATTPAGAAGPGSPGGGGALGATGAQAVLLSLTAATVLAGLGVLAIRRSRMGGWLLSRSPQ